MRQFNTVSTSNKYKLYLIYGCCKQFSSPDNSRNCLIQDWLMIINATFHELTSLSTAFEVSLALALCKFSVSLYSCSSSTKTPLQSLGWRNMTGFPWAPILGSGLRQRIFLALTSATAAWMSLTSIQMWWMPPALFFSKNPAMGDFSPNGCNSSNFVFESSTKTVVTPCSGRSWRYKLITDH